MRILKAVATIGGLTGISRIAGLVREVLIAHILGASMVAEAFIVAFKFPNFFRRIFAEGAFNAAFVPLFSGKLALSGRENATLTAQHIFNVMCLTLFVFVLFVEIFTPFLIHIIAYGFTSTPERLEAAIFFTRITFPYIFFISLSALLAGILNSFEKFFVAASVPILLNIIMIAALFSYNFLEISPGTALAFAVLFAGVAQFAWLYVACIRSGVLLTPKRPKLTGDVKILLRRMGPGTVGAGVMQLNLLIDMMLASLLPAGSMAYLFYADRLAQLPLSIFGIAIGTALLPLFSKYLQKNEDQKAWHTMEQAVTFSMQLSLPAAVGLMMLSYPIISLIYGHGAFGVYQINATAPALMMFALGLPAYVLSKVFMTPFFARGDTMTPLRIAIGSVGANIVLNVILMKFWQHVGMALATSISAWIQVGLLLFYLKKKQGWTLSKSFFQMVLRVTGSCVLMVAAIWSLPLSMSFSSLSDQIMSLGLQIGCGMVTYLAASHLSGGFSLHRLWKTTSSS